MLDCSPQAHIHLFCGFEGCDREFDRPEYTVSAGRGVFCSNACRASQAMLTYARQALPLKADGASHREVGLAIGGVDKRVAAHRWWRFRSALPKYPRLAAIYEQMRADIFEARSSP